MQQAVRPKLSADQWQALASSWARHGMPMGRVKTARRCVEAGIQLLMLKEVTPHGEFGDRVNALGLEASVARKYMAVARRFRVAPDAFFDAIGSASKLVELLPLDDADALAQGRAVYGLTLDRVAQMTVKELRAAVRAVVENERGERVLTADWAGCLARLVPTAQITAHLPERAARNGKSCDVATFTLPAKSTAKVHLNVEEERMLRRYRKCNADGRAALLQVAGLLAQAPAS